VKITPHMRFKGHRFILCFAKTSHIHKINDLATVHFQVTKV
jgi:hypothetical protein